MTNQAKWETRKIKNPITGFITSIFGKKIGFLGVDDSGKTTLTDVITEKNLSKPRKSTDYPNREKRIRVIYKGKELDFSWLEDLPGHRQNFEDKQKAFRQADYIVYVIRSDYILKAAPQKNDEEVNKYKLALLNDFKHFYTWRNSPKIIILGNYFGKYKNSFDHPDKDVPDFLDTKLSEQYGREFKGEVRKTISNFEDNKIKEFIVGSFASKELAYSLVHQLLDYLIKE